MPPRKGWKNRVGKTKKDVGVVNSKPKAHVQLGTPTRPAPTRGRRNMPPAASESGSDDLDQIPAKAKATKDVNMDDDEDDDDEEEDEDEYQVEKIEGHKLLKGQIHYRVNWLGYTKEEDKTWEPIENLENAKEALTVYHRAIGGTPEPPAKGKRGPKASLGKRNSSQADLDSPAPTSSKKGRGRKSEANGTAAVLDDLPVGSWEEHISKIAAIVESEETGLAKGKKDVTSLEGLLEWNSGRKTQHKMNVLRQKCPQRLLDYYESHLVFQGDPSFRRKYGLWTEDFMQYDSDGGLAKKQRRLIGLDD